MDLARVAKGIRQAGRFPEVFAAAGATRNGFPLPRPIWARRRCNTRLRSGFEMAKR